MMVDKSINIVLFEPWGLGDVAIALAGFGYVETSLFKLTLVCDSKNAEWATTISWVYKVIPIRIPWTDKYHKYSIGKYHLPDYLLLREQLKDIAPDFICEIRGDIRNYLLMKALNVAPVISLMNKKYHNRYERSFALLDILALSRKVKCVRKELGAGIVFFFGAAWSNRQVPNAIAVNIIRELLSITSVDISIILQPTDSFDFWRDLVADFSCVNIVQDSLLKISDLVSKAALVVSTDTSWLHIANIYGVPTVGLFGFKNAIEWAPPNCRVVYSDNPLPACARYKMKYEFLSPLADINFKRAAFEIYEYFSTTREIL